MRTATLTLSVLTIATMAAGCSSDAEPAAETTPANAAPTESEPVEPAPTGGPQIDIEGFAFSQLPAVAPGTEITVANLDGAQHTLTADDGSFNTGGLDGATTATITAPDAPGTYSFVCNIHPTMTGSLSVSG